MATQVQRRRGTASEHNTFTGAAGEVTVNTTNDSVHVHDGATAGGFETMRVDGDNSQVPLGPRSIQVFESSGTWTKPSGVNFIKVTVVGGGGGSTPGFSNDNSGSLGGSGGASIKVIDVTSVSSVSVTIGSGGSGTNSTSQTGAAGGTSSFGSFCSASGGGGGFGEGTHPADERRGGAAGEGTGGDFNLTGTGGTGGATGEGFNTVTPNGSPSIFGGGGRSGAKDSGINPDGFHGGGGGCRSQSLGGDGGDGIVVVEEFA